MGHAPPYAPPSSARLRGSRRSHPRSSVRDADRGSADKDLTGSFIQGEEVPLAGALTGHFCLNASSTCLLIALKFFDSSFSSSAVRIRNGTRTRLFASFTLSQCWPYWMPPGTWK